MKKHIAYTLIAALLCLALCGCGNQNPGQEDPMVVGTPVVPEMSPIISPMITPSLDDGIVKDDDGVIEELDTGTGQNRKDDKATDKTFISPSPKATKEP